MTTATPSEAGISRRALEIAFAIFVLVLAALVLWDSYGRGMGWGSDGPQGGYFPGRVGGVMAIAGLVVLWSALGAPRTVAVSYGQMRSVAKVLLPLLVYIALIDPLGIYVPSGFLMIALMLMFGAFKWWQTALGGLLTPLVAFVVFELQFRVPLPKGPLEAFLGY